MSIHPIPIPLFHFIRLTLPYLWLKSNPHFFMAAPMSLNVVREKHRVMLEFLLKIHHHLLGP